MSVPRYPVYAQAAPDGGELDVEPFVRLLLVDLLALLADEAAPHLDDLLSVLTPGTPPDPYQPERVLPTEDLIERLTDALPTTIRLHRPAMAVLHATLGQILRHQQRTAPVTELPRQQERRAS